MNRPLDSLSETSFEFGLSRSEAMTVSWQGRLLCSSRDPVAEATGWVRNQFFKENESVIVLGLGAGHHVLTLAAARPDQKIIVLDYHQTLIERFNSTFHVNNVQIKNVDSIHIDALKPLMRAALPVLGFRPAWTGLEKQYESLKRELCGQTVTALRIQAEAKGQYDLSQALNLRNKRFLSDFITVKDINSLMEIDKNNSESKMWQVLRELVK